MFATRADTWTSLIASISNSNVSSFIGWTSTFSKIKNDYNTNATWEIFERKLLIFKNGSCISSHLPECLWIDFRLFIVNVRLIWWYGSVISDVISWIMSGEPISDGPYPSSARASKHGWIFRNHIVRWDGWIWFIWWGVTRRIGRAMFDVFTGWILSNGSAIQITMARATPRKLRCSWGYRRGRRSYRA